MSIVPFAVWRPVPSHSGTMVAHQGLVLHVQVGNGSCYGEFSVPANQASSTWWVSKTGVLEQYVDSDEAAWTEAAGNFTWDSVETEGEPEEPLTDAQIATLARLYAWGMAEYGWPLAVAETPQDHGFGWHGMGGVAWGNHPDCPGVLRRAQRQAILDAVGHGPTPSPPSQEDDEMLSLSIIWNGGDHFAARDTAGQVHAHEAAIGSGAYTSQPLAMPKGVTFIGNPTMQILNVWTALCLCTRAVGSDGQVYEWLKDGNKAWDAPKAV